MSEIKPSIVQSAKRTQLPSDNSRNIGSLNTTSYIYDYGRSAVKLTELERNTTSQQHILNINKSCIGSQLTPFDDARVTVKQTVVGLTDTNRNYRPWVISGADNTGLTNWDPKSTQKESTIYNNYIRPITKNDGMGYAVANYDARATIKQTTLNENHLNQASGYNKNQMDYSSSQDPQKIRYAVHAENYKGPSVYFKSDSENRDQYFNADISIDKEQLIYKAPGQEFRGTNSHIGKIHAGNALIGDIKSTDNMLFKERFNNQSQRNIGNINNIIPNSIQIGTSTKTSLHNLYSQMDVFNSDDPTTQHNRFNSDLITQQLSQNPWYNIKKNV
jgi:hypothetical protein